MKHNDDKYLIAIDFETANSNPLSACQVGIIVFYKGELVFEFESLIKPPKQYSKFNYYNTKIHNIVASDVKDALTWKELYSNFREFFSNSVMVAHNAAFDMKVLYELNTFYEIKENDIDYYCTVELSRKILPYLSNHKLNTVSSYFEIELNHHDAKSDAYACGLIIFKCLQMTGLENVSEMFEKTNMFAKRLTF